MKKYFVALLIPLALVAVWTFAHNRETPENSVATTTEKKKRDEALISAMITELLENGHFTRKRMNDDISRYAFKDYLEKLDFNKAYFLKSDIDKLKQYETEIDNEMHGSDPKFYFEATKLVKKRIEEVKSMYETLLEEPFDFSKKEKFELDPDKRDYPANEQERKAFWRSYLKYLTLNRFANKIEKQEDDRKAAEKNGEEFEPKSKAELEEAARKQVAKNMKTRFDRRDEIDEEDQFAAFINSVAAAYGPHTEYFPPQEKENFDMRMTGRLEGIGAQLTKEGEYITVLSIVPGSASWKQGELEKNDKILKVAQGDEEPVDIVDAPMKEAISMIRGKKGTEVRLTVRKPDGEEKVIPIIRDVVIQEETYAKSALITSEHSGEKYGYVYLPSFYFKSRGKGRSCAEDVKNEIDELEEMGVAGIVLDLRNNGGGSLQDAIRLAGHFIESGPVVQVRNTGQSAEVLKDRDPNISYEGPMVVMVNNFSASASEILGAALKDYKRAILIGTNTLGKGTVQTFYDLNRMKGPNPSEGELGALKLTFQQFYRVNGASTQLHGVSPDITLPDQYGYMETGLRSYENALPFDSIDPVYYDYATNIDYNIAKLRKGSAKRVKKSEVFQALLERNAQFAAEREETEESLLIDDELASREQRRAANKDFNNLFNGDKQIVITSLQKFKPEEEDEVKEERKANWEKQLNNDYYLNEVIYIMDDLMDRLN